MELYLPPITNVAKIEFGAFHYLVLKDDGTIYGQAINWEQYNNTAVLVILLNKLLAFSYK